jgi:predicted ABC-type ATPase
MTEFLEFDRRPIVVAVAGPNGAGKTTFFYTYLATSGLRFINADVLAGELAVEADQAARLANALREALIDRKESFVFETVFSDQVQDKLSFLEEAVQRGYEVVLYFIRLANVSQSIERVAMRVLKGGHDVPDDKLRSRFARTLRNLQLSIHRLPHVLIFDNSDLSDPYRHIASFDHGVSTYLQEPLPDWLRSVID